ncbi:MAG: competence/damage-inducible protein A [Verrucomicrobia bacterium]|nr:competence/damage-inducible protein A [Verrucomicrobiota bacterium]
MRIELINTGSELMLGRVLNTHQQWICRRLADAGYPVSRQTAVPDDGPSILEAIREALPRADLIITTGGLGPTSDDLTRDLVARQFGLALREDARALANIDSFFQSRKRPMPPSTRVQAQVPEGADVLYNEHGTAPGLAIPIQRPNEAANRRLPQWLILLPGPPRELHPMFHHQALPRIAAAYPREHPFFCRTLRTVGLGESWVEERIGAAMAPLTGDGLELGYCARTGEVDVRFTTQSSRGPELIATAERLARGLLGDAVFGVDDDTLEEALLRELNARGRTVSFAESCTGGCVASRFTSVPGASQAFRGGVVAYHNEVKQELLGVSSELIQAHGAVSKPVAAAMAEGARRILRSDYAVSTTGIAGPGGGSVSKPVGLVYIGIATKETTKVVQKMNPWDRETFQQVTSKQALDSLRRMVIGAG